MVIPDSADSSQLSPELTASLSLCVTGGKDLVSLLQGLLPHSKYNGPGSPQGPLPTMPHACDEANFTYRSVTLETSASSLIPAIWFCSPPGAYKTALFSRNLTSLLAAGCLSGGTSDPCHPSGLRRNSHGNIAGVKSMKLRTYTDKFGDRQHHISKVETMPCSFHS